VKLYAEYIKEKYNREIIYDDFGYISYNKLDNDTIFVHTLFVTAEKRREGKGQEYERLLIRKEKPSMILCNIDTGAEGSREAFLALVNGGGYSLLEAEFEEEDKIYLFKEVNYAKEERRSKVKGC
jgi:hypothetical protein